MKKHAEDIGVSTAWKKNFFKSLFGDRQRNFLLTLSHYKIMQKHFSVQEFGTIKSLRLSINKIPLYMRLSILFLFCFWSLAQAEESYAQKTKISIEANNQSVGAILEEIEAQTDFDFFFNHCKSFFQHFFVSGHPCC